ncbi:MAG: 50S ribosomal protein L21 [Desulfotomaculum sp. 46_296]|nr:MAG: 50S ribosomal protein L21 [Desulfotomaculum sp. 46_296]KUK84420.1 MAG: 50S ribosomal protein L21 [Desulfofundulus kuznetsovii]HAU31674.1 50S ribosomal protein L21 [Desulfotomaculum sp.]
MYAVIETGGRQYRVREKETLLVDKLPVEAGQEITIDKVLAVSDGENIKIGTPFVTGAKVTLKAVDHGRGRKVIVFKYKAKKNYRRKKGARRAFTQVFVEKIEEIV